MLAIVCPGQGSQRPGLLEPWLRVPGIEARLHAWSHLVGADLLELGTVSTADALRETKNAQRLIFATSVVVGSWLMSELDTTPQLVAGHSIGEWSAAVLAGVLAPEDAGRLVGVRADAMDEQCRDGGTGLVALIGPDVAAAQAIAVDHGLDLANVNAGVQTVLGGPLTAIDRLVADPPAGVRTRRLDVAGAFHTSRMLPAVEILAAAAAHTRAGAPSVPVVSNLDGEPVRDGDDLVRRLVRQVAAPVRWDLCTSTFGRMGVDIVVEVEPAGVLAGLARRALPDATVIAMKGPEQLDDVREALTRSTDRTATLTEGVTA